MAEKFEDDRSEAGVQAAIMLHGMEINCRLLRNNSGAFKDETGRVVRFGLGNVSKAHNDAIKSSDLIGFKVVTVTQDMVGQDIAVFTAVEVKAADVNIENLNDSRGKAQKAFVTWVKKHGGYAGVANSIDSFLKIFEKP